MEIENQKDNKEETVALPSENILDTEFIGQGEKKDQDIELSEAIPLKVVIGKTNEGVGLCGSANLIKSNNDGSFIDAIFTSNPKNKIFHSFEEGIEILKEYYNVENDKFVKSKWFYAPKRGIDPYEIDHNSFNLKKFVQHVTENKPKLIYSRKKNNTTPSLNKPISPFIIKETGNCEQDNLAPATVNLVLIQDEKKSLHSKNSLVDSNSSSSRKKCIKNSSSFIEKKNVSFDEKKEKQAMNELSKFKQSLNKEKSRNQLNTRVNNRSQIKKNKSNDKDLSLVKEENKKAHYICAFDMFSDWFERSKEKGKFNKEATAKGLWDNLPKTGTSRMSQSFWEEKFYYRVLGHSWEQKPVYNEEGNLVRLIDRPMPWIKTKNNGEDVFLTLLNNQRKGREVNHLSSTPSIEWNSELLKCYFARNLRTNTLHEEPLLYGITGKRRINGTFNKLRCRWSPRVEYSLLGQKQQVNNLNLEQSTTGNIEQQEPLIETWHTEASLYLNPKYIVKIKRFNRDIKIYSTNIISQFCKRIESEGEISKEWIDLVNEEIKVELYELDILREKEDGPKPRSVRDKLLDFTKTPESKEKVKKKEYVNKIMIDWASNERKLLPVGNNDDDIQEKRELGLLPPERENPLLIGLEDKLLLLSLKDKNTID